jgi:adenine-specific DNA-methyltransferase
LKSIKYSINDYRAFVNNYKNATDKDEKRGFEKLIDQIKGDFRSEIGKSDPKLIRKNKLGGELFNLLNQVDVFEPSEKEKKDRGLKKKKLEDEINKLTAEIEEIKSSAIYKDAFEWRFEFPEVLDKEGKFIGFDAVIGNPPYIRQEELTAFKEDLKLNFKAFSGTADILVYFIERGISLLRNEGNFSFIVANKFLRAGFGKPVRNYIQSFQLIEVLDFGDLPVFQEATTYPCIISIAKRSPSNSFKAINFDILPTNDLRNYVHNMAFSLDQKLLTRKVGTLSRRISN